MSGRSPISLEGRFWEKVQRNGKDECWPWLASRNQKGYGWFRRFANDRQGGIHAHRMAWILENGEVPIGMLVCHHCDNRICVNPAHLFIGTAADNAQDASRKHRIHRPQKLNWSQILEIRGLADGGMLQREIGALYGVNQTLISQITRRIIWQHEPHNVDE